jgi:predicted lipoprotein with Yx(FWY)xxD motif
MSNSSGLKISIAAFATAGLLLVTFVSSASASTAVLQSVNVAGFPGALANHASRTVYVLSVEKGAKLKCKGVCLSAWIPVTVNDSVTAVSLGANVKGKIGFVARGATTKQVTFNSYPLYTFAGDAGARQSRGEGKPFDGGKWYVAKAASTSVSTTPLVKAASAGGGTTTTTGGSGTTTTTTKGGTTTTTTTTGGGIGY